MKSSKKEKVLMKVKEKVGFFYFLGASSVFVLIIFFENHFFPSEKILVKLNVLGRTSVVAALLCVLIFLALEKKNLLSLKKIKINWPVFALFLVLHSIFYSSFFFFKKYVILNPNLVEDYFSLLVVLRYLLPVLMVLTLGFALYGFDLVKKFYRGFIIAGILGMGIYQFSMLFKKTWPIFAKLTTKSVAFLLDLSFDRVNVDFSKASGPRLQVMDFSVYITHLCSGTEGLSLFLFLYLFIIILERKNIRPIRALVFGLFGLFGMVFLNILRIYTLMLVGVFYSKDFAIHTFHTNIGWILFVLYFLVFWVLAQPLVMKKRTTGL